MRTLALALTAALLAAARPRRPDRRAGSRRRPRPAPRSRSSSARPTARPRSTATTATRSRATALKYTSNVVKVFSPNATWSKVQGGRQRRLDRRVPGPRQRLAEPVHVRPELHDQGRLRAQRRPQQRRQAQRLREQVLRRAVDPDADAGQERRRPAVPPLLRLGQLRAGRRRPDADDREEARRQLRRRRSSRPAPAP